MSTRTPTLPASLRDAGGPVVDRSIPRTAFGLLLLVCVTSMASGAGDPARGYQLLLEKP